MGEHANGNGSWDASARRLMVPSPREREMGADAVSPDLPSGPTKAAPRRRRAGAVSRFVKDVDPRSIGGPKLPLVVLGLSALLAHWDVVALGVLLPEIRSEFGLSLQVLLTVGSVLGIVTIVLGPAMGYLADRIKRVWMLRVGSLVAGAGSVVGGLAGGLPQLVAGRAMGGVGHAVTAPAGFPLLSDYFPVRSRARVFAFLGFAGGLGALAGPTVAGTLADAYGWRVAVVSLGVLSIVVTLGFLLLREPVRGYQDRLEMGADEETARREPPAVGWSEAWRAAGSISTLRRLWYAAPFLYVAEVGIAPIMLLYFSDEFGLGPRERGYIATITAAVALAGIVVAAPLADRLLHHRPGRVMSLIAGLLVLYSLSLLVLVFSGNLWLSIIVQLPLGFGFVALSPAFLTLISLVVPARIRGLGLRTIDPWRLIGAAMLPFIGAAADSWGLRRGMLLFVPIWLIGAVIVGTAGFNVERDMGAATAASMADEESRRSRQQGRSKLLVCRDVDVSYGDTQVVFNVDLDVEQGEMVALVGTNGAGKSSLLRAIAGVQEASNGAIFLDGEDITHLPPHQATGRGVVFVPGGRAVFPSLTVAENLRTAAWMHRRDDEYMRRGLEKVYGLFPVLRQRRRVAAGDLSAGEQQMVALGQAFLMQPRLLMIDELSLGLAPRITTQLVEILRQVKAAGTTVVLIEQSLTLVSELAGRAVFMEKGEIRFDGPMQELMGRSDLVRSVLMGRVASSERSRSAGAGRVHSRTSATTSKRLLEVADASVSFGGVQALTGAGLHAAAGEVVGVIGPNGAGKTTLFDVISGFVPPDAGRVLIDGTDVSAMGPDGRARAGLGRSFQNVRLFPTMVVRENIAACRERHFAVRNAALAAVWSPRVRNDERRAFRRADELIDLLGLGYYADRHVGELSTGTRRAVDIACIMAAEPSVVLLDEPSSGLSQAESQELQPLLARVVADTGCAMIVIEHDLALVASLADRLVAMDLGTVVATGFPDEVLSHPRVLSSYIPPREKVPSASNA